MHIIASPEFREKAKKNVAVEVYLLNAQQVSAALLDPEADITQPPHRELAGDTYVVLRVRNNGQASIVSGELICKRARYGFKNRFEILHIRQNRWSYYVAPGGRNPSNTSDEIPAYTWEWKSFMVK